MVEKIKRGEERPRKRAPSHDLCQTHSSLIQGDFEKGKNPIDLAPLFLRLDLRKTEPAVSPWLFSSERFPFQGRREGERASEREKARGNTLQFEERKETSSRAKREEFLLFFFLSFFFWLCFFIFSACVKTREFFPFS